MKLLHNIDDVRAEIMRLESAPVFDAVAWAKVLADMDSQGRVAGLADARRRMETARENQIVVGVDLVSDTDETVYCFMCVRCHPFRYLDEEEVLPIKGPPNEKFICPFCANEIKPLAEGTTGMFMFQTKRLADAGCLSIGGLLWCGSDYPKENCCEYHTYVAVETEGV